MGRTSALISLVASALLLTACGAQLSTTNLAGVRVEILPQADVQSKCFEKGVGMPPSAGYSLPTLTLGCTYWHNDGSLQVFSIDSAEVLLHELDHAFNTKRCHSQGGKPAYCGRGGRTLPDGGPKGDPLAGHSRER